MFVGEEPTLILLETLVPIYLVKLLDGHIGMYGEFVLPPRIIRESLVVAHVIPRKELVFINLSQIFVNVSVIQAHPLIPEFNRHVEPDTLHFVEEPLGFLVIIESDFLGLTILYSLCHIIYREESIVLPLSLFLFLLFPKHLVKISAILASVCLFLFSRWALLKSFRFFI